MAKLPGPPRIRKWRGVHTVFYYDHDKQRHMRRSCSAMDANTKDERAELLLRLRREDKERSLARIKGAPREHYDRNLIDALGVFLADVKARAQARIDAPDSRAGLARASAYELRTSTNLLVDWLKSNGHSRLATGELSANHLREFVRQFSVGKPVRGGKEVEGTRSIATVNRVRRNVGAALTFLDEMRPKLIPDMLPLRRALKVQALDHDEPATFSPAELNRFYRALLEYEDPDRLITAVRRYGKNGQPTVSQYERPAQFMPTTPPSRVFLIAVLTGARLGEVLALKWEHINFERGLIRFRKVQKTGRSRTLPLVGAPELDISPGLLALLREWRLQAGDREYVLPHAEPTEKHPNPRPRFARRQWSSIARRLGMPSMLPQSLRQNFASYACSLGVPDTTCALWLGHGAEVSARWYRSWPAERNTGKNLTLEQAMGLAFEAVAEGSQYGAG